MAPDVYDWYDSIWAKAEVVWSYYDLNLAIEMDALAGKFPAYLPLTNFYHAPLGADAEVFVADPNVKKLFTIATSGQSRLQESVRECWLAAQEIEGMVFHVGPRIVDLTKSKGIWFSENCGDSVLAATYQQCEFVSGLRRKEGFELPAVEGLLCGARPILFNSSDYRTWYEPWGHFIEEGSRQEVVDQLVELFKRGARPVTAEEREQAVERFNWETIIKGFYDHLR
jgi:glycosyltransferase involved in cell wall biosynthesis